MDRTDTTPFEASAIQRPDERRLFIEEQGLAPRVVSIAKGTAYQVGRGDEAEIMLDDRRASRIHAKVAFDGVSVVVEDAGSSNGTFLGSHRVTEATRFEPGMLLRIGSTNIALLPHDDDDLDESPSTHTASVRGFVPVADAPRSKELFELVGRLASSELSVLIEGEPGVGKEVVARTIHAQSPRAGGPFVVVSGTVLTDALAESELFGHERGVGGAESRKIGAFEAAQGGTLLLDDVSEFSPLCQAAVLRVLAANQVVRAGATRATPVDIRVLATTQRDLAREVAEGRFREDLYFRLQGVKVRVAPLRERQGDIPGLAAQFFSQRGRHGTIHPALLERLRGYDWPGNVRELHHALDVAMAMAGEGVLPGAEHLPANIRPGATFEDMTPTALRQRVDLTEKQAIVAALGRNNGNQSRAARELRISRRALIYKMERHGLKAPPKSQRARDA